MRAVVTAPVLAGPTEINLRRACPLQGRSRATAVVEPSTTSSAAPQPVPYTIEASLPSGSRPPTILRTSHDHLGDSNTATGTQPALMVAVSAPDRHNGVPAAAPSRPPRRRSVRSRELRRRRLLRCGVRAGA